MVDSREESVAERIECLGLLDFSARGDLSPELIDVVLESTEELYKSLDFADIAARIAASKAEDIGA